MKIWSLPDFPSPVLVIDEFLPPAAAWDVLGECLSLRPVYMPARVGQGQENRVDDRLRRNDVVYLDSVFSPAPDRSVILRTMKGAIWSQEAKQIWHAGDFVFDIVNYATHHETVLSRYGTCDFYGRHQDTKHDKTDPGSIRHRLVTMVYYVNRTPEKFTGGALTLHKNQKSLTVDPAHNRLVVFPSFTFHEVEKVTLEDDAFENGRFSLNIWLGFK
ncbi:MAG TPA: 2OG-Fe(II) oxygenase [Bryobacteraceae bacterium]|jgi:Rps23 Pro-64 3,4-dihydroxylase Tpa1-like proline 4-hydroxylase|nr:2OG-Fe(II) oxygenase [Bryobacteraceae bacterium]